MKYVLEQRKNSKLREMRTLQRWLSVTEGKILLRTKLRWNYSTEYTELTKKGNEDLLQYYNEWKEQIRFFKELMKGKSLNPDMVPSLLRGVVETALTGGNPFNTIKNKFIRSISIDSENEENIGKEASKSIPLRYMAPPRKADGSVDMDMISVDLTRSMIEFGDSVFEYVENSKIEGDLLIIRQLLTMSRTTKMDGNHIIRDSRGKPKTDDPKYPGTKFLHRCKVRTVNQD